MRVFTIVGSRNLFKEGYEMIDMMLHHLHLTFVFLVAVSALVYAFLLHWRGRTGDGDLTTLFLRFSQQGESARFEACSVGTDKLKDVIDNIYLRCVIHCAFWYHQRIALYFADKDMRQKILSEFRDHLSQHMNGHTAASWACRKDCEPDAVSFVFSVSDLASSTQRKLRLVVLLKKDLEWVKDHGTRQLSCTPKLDFLKPLLEEMATNPAVVEGVLQFLPSPEHCSVA